MFIAHYFFKVDKLLRDNLDYIIFTKLDKREVTSLYNTISLDLTSKQFQEINNNLKTYDFIAFLKQILIFPICTPEVYKSEKSEFALKTLSEYAPPNNSSPPTFV